MTRCNRSATPPPSNRGVWALAALLAGASCGARADTTYAFSLDGAYKVSAAVFDGKGRNVRTLLRGNAFEAGPHALQWDNRDDAGRPLPATQADATGRAQPARYEIRMLQSAVTYTWEGVIGNTSASFSGPGVFRSYLPPSSLAASATSVYFTTGYNELQPFGQGFAMNAPGTQILPISQAPQSSVGNSDQFVSMDMVATDGVNIYWANTGNAQIGSPLSGVAAQPVTSFVAVSNIQSGGFTSFTSGQGVCLDYWQGVSCYPSALFLSVADLHQGNPTWQPTGIAVQSNGNLLAVAHATAAADTIGTNAQSNITLLDKASGQVLGTFAIPYAAYASHPQNTLTFDPNGNLWLISGKTVTCYSSLLAPGGPTVLARIANLANPLAVAASPNLPVTVLVADGGSSQTVKAFNAAGTPTWTFGRKGGYELAPAASTAKLSFHFDWPSGPAGYTYTINEMSGLTMLADGSFWVIDTGNGRLLHISNQHAFVEQVAYRPASYSATVDPNSPTRVFSNFLEYKVSTGTPLKPGMPASGPSWTLVRNWRDSLPTNAVVGVALMQGFNTVTTVGGHTYALADIGGNQGGDAELFELPASGPARDTGIRMSAACPPPAGSPDQPTGCVLYENGDLGYALGPSASLSTQTVYRRTFNGADSNGNPVWGAPVAVASVSATLNNLGDPFYHVYTNSVLIGPRFPITSAPGTSPASEVVYFDPTVGNQCSFPSWNCNNGNHLGAVASGGTSFAWQASSSGVIDFNHPTGAFETDAVQQQCVDPATLQYGGTSVWAVGSSIVFGYRGEGITPVIAYTDPYNGVTYTCPNQGEANQVMHFGNDGMFIGEFGTPGIQGVTDQRYPTEPGQAGNALSSILVANGTNSLYWYSSDENGHGGVHRWRIDGIQSIKTQRATGVQGQMFNLQPAR